MTVFWVMSQDAGALVYASDVTEAMIHIKAMINLDARLIMYTHLYSILGYVICLEYL